MSPKIQVELPLKVIEKITEDIQGTSIKTVEAYVETMVLQKHPELNEKVYTEEEEQIIEERLRKLGYL